MVKRAPLVEAEKQHLMQRRRAGATLREVARELNCAMATARKWWRYGRDSYQPQPRGRPVLGILSIYPAELVEQAVALKRSHPHWGPAKRQAWTARATGARYPHRRWQADAQEQIRLTSGELATILNVRDEYSAAIIASRAFVTTTAQGWRKLTLGEVQTTVRQASESVHAFYWDLTKS
jgi:transposase-like protein